MTAQTPRLSAMSLVEVVTVERFAHALGEPLSAGLDAVVGDIEARTGRMTEAVDQVVARFAPTPDATEASLAGRLKVVEGMVAMLSSGIAAYAEMCEAVPDRTIREAMYDAHDAMVGDYYRLLALRADLDPEARGLGDVLKTPEEIRSWFAKALE